MKPTVSKETDYKSKKNQTLNLIIMNPQLEKLLEVQSVDYEIYELERKKSEKPGIIDSLNQEINNICEQLEQSEEDLKQLQLKMKEKEIELESNENEIKKYESQLYQVKTNKEYSSLEHEIQGVKADNSVLEEEMISLLDEIDVKKNVIDERKKEIDNKKKELDDKKKEIDLDIKEIKQRIDKLQANRKEIVKEIDDDILQKYERILQNKHGKAMAKVVDGACGSCYMNLPPQVENEIRLGSFVICQSCSKILYMEDM